MTIIAVINSKGGSGKSTTATHIAAWLAHQGVSVMLGDVDRQQSSRAWLSRRGNHLPRIVPWALDLQRNVVRVPLGTTHVVLDTAGAIHGLDLARVVVSANAIVMPVCGSIFDRESASACIAELRSLPRPGTGKCPLGIIGMRIQPGSAQETQLARWADTEGLPLLGIIPLSDRYVGYPERGETLFDQEDPERSTLLEAWQPVLNWLRPLSGLSCVPQTEQPRPHTRASGPAGRFLHNFAAGLRAIRH